MIKRDIENELINLSAQYPVITITGPRQAGKTTLSKIVFNHYNYCNLELPDLRRMAAEDPRALFAAFPPPLIIDEVQRVPDLLSYVQIMADEIDKPGQFILTGSHHLDLHQAITQSLVGRTALLTLLPLSIKELTQSGHNLNRDQYIFNGFLPRIYKDNLEPHKAYRNYYQTYIERDLRQVSNIRNLSQYEKFIHILAGRVGQLINLNALSGDIGVSSTTLNEWLSILEASFIIFRLKPYHANFGKRIVKSAKLYFTDVGLAAYLLGIKEVDQVTRDPLVGSLFENMVILEAMKTLMNRGAEPDLFFYRDVNQKEIDLIYKEGNRLMPVEIKAAMTYSDTLHKNLKYFHDLSGSEKGYLIYAGELEYDKNNLAVLNYVNTYKLFE